MVEIKRKLYKRGSSFETTVPMPLLFAIDKSKKHYVVFKYDDSSNRWYVELEKMEEEKEESSEEEPEQKEEPSKKEGEP